MNNVTGTKHIVLVLIRHRTEAGVTFLLHSRTSHGPAAPPLLGLPSKTTIENDPEQFVHGTSLEAFVDALMHERLGLPDSAYALEEEIEPVEADMLQPSSGQIVHYVAYPIEVWVDPAEREALRRRAEGQWLTVPQVLARADLTPTAFAVFNSLPAREQRIQAEQQKPKDKQDPRKLGRLMLAEAPDRPSMEALARKWFARNRAGVRIVTHQWLDEVLDTGDRALNLRVADPYLRYQQQGVGFTWSFFTDKDAQDVHVHSAPIVEIYGVLDGQLEIWWKPYHDRGTSAWAQRVLNSGDWAEVDSLQCHYVRWIGKGKGVVFKAGPGPLAEVGKLGVKGKTRCEGCPCMKPQALKEG